MNSNSVVVHDLLDTLGENLDLVTIINVISIDKLLITNLYDINFWNRFKHNIRPWLLEMLNKNDYTETQVNVCKFLYDNYGFLFNSIEEYANLNLNNSEGKTTDNLEKLFGVKFAMSFNEDIIDLYSDGECLQYTYDKCQNKIVYPLKSFKFVFEGVTYNKDIENNKGFTVLDICKALKEMFEAPLTETQKKEYFSTFFLEDDINGENTSQLFPPFSISGIKYDNEENAWVYIDYSD